MGSKCPGHEAHLGHVPVTTPRPPDLSSPGRADAARQTRAPGPPTPNPLLDKKQRPRVTEHLSRQRGAGPGTICAPLAPVPVSTLWTCKPWKDISDSSPKDRGQSAAALDRTKTLLAVCSATGGDPWNRSDGPGVPGKRVCCRPASPRRSSGPRADPAVETTSCAEHVLRTKSSCGKRKFGKW